MARVSTVMMLLLLVAMFHHASLGLQVIIEDYVHTSWKFAVLVLVRTTCFALAVIGILATLRIAFSG
jgi:succinate dehydrogenase / fumarate reductase membrane anchor subunit